MNQNTYIPEEETELSHGYASGSRICTRIVGVTFDNRQSIIAKLMIGDRIRLTREPNNPYDRNAIRADQINGLQIGYLNRYLVAKISPFFDEFGQSVVANVHCITGSIRPGYSLGVIVTFTLP